LADAKIVLFEHEPVFGSGFIGEFELELRLHWLETFLANN
jgi:hypothetical protein